MRTKVCVASAIVGIAVANSAFGFPNRLKCSLSYEAMQTTHTSGKRVNIDDNGKPFTYELSFSGLNTNSPNVSGQYPGIGEPGITLQKIFDSGVGNVFFVGAKIVNPRVFEFVENDKKYEVYLTSLNQHKPGESEKTTVAISDIVFGKCR